MYSPVKRNQPANKETHAEENREYCGAQRRSVSNPHVSSELWRTETFSEQLTCKRSYDTDPTFCMERNNFANYFLANYFDLKIISPNTKCRGGNYLLIAGLLSARTREAALLIAGLLSARTREAAHAFHVLRPGLPPVPGGQTTQGRSASWQWILPYCVKYPSILRECGEGGTGVTVSIHVPMMTQYGTVSKSHGGVA